MFSEYASRCDLVSPSWIGGMLEVCYANCTVTTNVVNETIGITIVMHDCITSRYSDYYCICPLRRRPVECSRLWRKKRMTCNMSMISQWFSIYWYGNWKPVHKLRKCRLGNKLWEKTDYCMRGHCKDTIDSWIWYSRCLLIALLRPM